jgi:hypothetical protein
MVPRIKNLHEKLREGFYCFNLILIESHQSYDLSHIHQVYCDCIFQLLKNFKSFTKINSIYDKFV